MLSKWENIPNKIPQRSGLGLILFNIFSFDDDICRKPFKIAYDTELEGAENTLKPDKLKKVNAKGRNSVKTSVKYHF